MSVPEALTHRRRHQPEDFGDVGEHDLQCDQEHAGAERVLGWAAAEVLGRSADLIWTAEDRAAGVPAAERKRALADGRATDERWHLRRGGAQFWGSGLLMPLLDGGRPVGFVKILRDRTAEQAAAESALDGLEG